MKNDEIRNERLAPLSELGEYKVAKDNPDVLGWRVIGADGESLGMVKDLVVDVKAMKARYLSVIADRRFFNTSKDPYLLIPIGAAALDKKGKKVFLSGIDSNSIGRYPVYPGGPISEDYEYAVRDTYLHAQQENLNDYSNDFDEATRQHQSKPGYVPGDFYNDTRYSEERFYTSDADAHRDRNHTSRDADKDEDDNFSAADLHDEERRPKTVEDSIATIERLEQLRERGSITDEEFILLKKRALDL